jgi:hypothetical protein
MCVRMLNFRLLLLIILSSVLLALGVLLVGKYIWTNYPELFLPYLLWFFSF